MAVSNYVVGILIALCTTFLSAFGLVLQKRVHGRLSIEREELLRQRNSSTTASVSSSSSSSSSSKPKEYPKHLRSYNQPLWIIGMGCLIVSSLLSLAVFSLLGQAVASAMASVTIIWNLILARLLLHEAFTSVDAVVTSFLLIGAVVAVVCGRQGTTIESALSPRTIQNLWTRDVVIIFTPLIGVAMILCVWYNSVIRERRKSRSATRRQIQLAEILLLFLSGCFSGFTGLLSRGFVSLLSYAIQEDASTVFTWWGFYMFPLFLLPSLICQITCVNLGLKMADATEVVPQYQSWIVTLGVIFGYVYYNEGSGKTTGALIGFWTGIVLIIIGISLLFLKRKPEPVSLVVAQEVNHLLIYNTIPVLSTDVPNKSISFDPSRSFHRSQSAPPGMLRKDTEILPFLTSPTVPYPIHHKGRINLSRKSGTVQKVVKLRYYGEEASVSDEELLNSPRPPKHFIGVPGIEDYIETSIEIQACYPVVPAMVSAPVHDNRYYRTLHFVNLCQLQSEKITLIRSSDKQIIRTAEDTKDSSINNQYSMETKSSYVEILKDTKETESIIPLSVPKTTKRAPRRWYEEAHHRRPSTPHDVQIPIPFASGENNTPIPLPTDASFSGPKQRRKLSTVVTDLWQMNPRKENDTAYSVSSGPTIRSDHHRSTVSTTNALPVRNLSPSNAEEGCTRTVPEEKPTHPSRRKPSKVSCIMEPSYVRIPVALTKYASISPSLLAAGLRLKAAEEEAMHILHEQNSWYQKLQRFPHRFFATMKKHASHKSVPTVAPTASFRLSTPSRNNGSVAPKQKVSYTVPVTEPSESKLTGE